MSSRTMRFRSSSLRERLLSINLKYLKYLSEGGVFMEASDGSESVAARRVRTRRTWTLSMACGVSGWLLIACMIVWGVVNILTAANEDGATLRDYGFVVAIFLVLLLLFVINVIGALVGFVDLLRCRTRREVMQSCLALFLNVLPWIIVGTWTWMV